MADDNEQSWWRSTQLLAFGVLVVGGGLGLSVIAFAPTAGIGNAADISRTLQFSTLLVPGVVLFLIFWAAARQRRIDRQHGYFEE
jgi:hypothetical protein